MASGKGIIWRSNAFAALKHLDHEEKQLRDSSEPGNWSHSCALRLLACVLWGNGQILTFTGGMSPGLCVSSSCSVIFFLEMGWGAKASVQISHHFSADYFTCCVSNGPGQTTKEEKAIRRSFVQQSWVSLFCWLLSFCFFLTSFFLTEWLRILPELRTQYSCTVNSQIFCDQLKTEQIR